MSPVGLAFFFGAACEDAADWQLTALRAFWVERAAEFRAGTFTVKQVENAVRKIMGPTWRPGTAWVLAGSAVSGAIAARA